MPMDGGGRKARAVGINHVALEVGDVEAALDFYGSIFQMTLRGRIKGVAFIELGDQFIALAESHSGQPDRLRHFGLVVDERDAVRRRLEELEVEILPVRGLDFRDPWGNRVQVVQYSDIQFTKAPNVLKGMGLEGLEKSAEALRELEKKGMVP